MDEWIAGLGVNEYVALASAALALVSFGFNWAVVQRQSAMQFESLKTQSDSALLAWAHESIDTLSEAAFLARGRGSTFPEDELRVRALEVLRRLSSAADKGRLFFPNFAPHEKGNDNEGAFQGFRPPVLDCLIFAYIKLERMDLRNLDSDMDTCFFLTRCRRAFVSEVQRAVDPRRRSRMMRELSKGGGQHDSRGFKEAAHLAEMLERAHPGVLEAKRDGAWVEEMARRARASR